MYDSYIMRRTQIYLDEGDLTHAEYHFQTALRLNPEDVLARQGLQRIANLSNKRP